MVGAHCDVRDTVEITSAVKQRPDPFLTVGHIGRQLGIAEAGGRSYSASACRSTGT